MNVKRAFPRVFFDPSAIRKAYAVLEEMVKADPKLGSPPDGKDPLKVTFSSLYVERGRTRTCHDDEEQFFADYRNRSDTVFYGKNCGKCGIHIHYQNENSDVSVECRSRSVIDAVLNSFEESAPSNRLSDPPPPPKPKPVPPVQPKIFIGHGHSGLWRELKDHLTDKHGLEVIAYEVGAREGHTIRDILEDMLTKSTMAFLVLTGEDRDAEGLMHARENVIHETGLFQGRLGFARAIVLLEKGTAEFSNIHGIAQLRFAKGNIKEVFGDVVALIRREFGPRA